MHSRRVPRSHSAGLAYAVLVGLVGAGIVHVAVLLLLPEFSERDPWSRLAEHTEVYVMSRIDGTPSADVIHGSADPLFYVNACRFSLEDGYAHITAPGKVPFWSVSIYDRTGQNLYSFNDRSSTEGELDVVVVTPAQMIDVRKELPQELVSSVFVEADVNEGIAMVRAFVPDESWAPRLASYMKSMHCSQE